MIIFRNMTSTKIKKFYKERISQRGPLLVDRAHRKFQFLALINYKLMVETAEKRASVIIKNFLLDNKIHHYIKVKIKQTWERAERIKSKFQIFRKRSYTKFKIFSKFFEKLIVK